MRCLLIIIVGFLFGCNTSAQTNTEVSAEVFEKGLVDKQVQLLDVRTASEFRSGHIKNALQANWNDRAEFEKRIAALEKNKPVYIYCLSGPRSSAAAQWLRNKGFVSAANHGQTICAGKFWRRVVPALPQNGAHHQRIYCIK
jgi:rhodanese-related sulfurtransferase